MTELEKQEAKVKVCDNKSVGMIIRKGKDILLIERRKPPFGFAPPAGHLDGDTFDHSALREAEEEVGLKSKNIKLLTEGRKENRCRRSGGNWHYWKIYEIKTEGEIQRSEEETKQAGWFNIEQIKNLASKTQRYLDGQISESEWQGSPGLEPVWYEWFKELGIL